MEKSLNIIESMYGTTFHLFPKLPIELRLKMRGFAAMLPQLVGVQELVQKSGLYIKNRA
jgi:hypothetical protein